MNLALVDSGVANLTSVKAALTRLGIEACVTSDAATIAGADRVILPGVGAASSAMRELEQRGLIGVLQGLKQPVLGICLGMQILFESSDEGGGVPCLGIVPGRVRQLETKGEPLPHMGWNEIEPLEGDAPLLCGIDNGTYMYFVHSFAVPVGAATLARCTYGEPFSAMMGFRNFYGCQFHPERSGAAGQTILQNFIEGCA